jgi:adenylate cyclase
VPPEEVVVVTIDRESSDRFGLPNLPRKWPRELHAQLVERLHELGARIVVFDVLFHEPRDPEQDRRLAEALRATGNVILVEYLRKETLPANGADAGAIIEQRVRPLPELDQAALATAPFTLPKVPVKVSQTWLFKPEAGDVPSVPAVALQAYLHADGEALLRRIDALGGGPVVAAPAGRLDEVVRGLRLRFVGDRGLSAQLRSALETDTGLDADQRERLAALIELYAGLHSRHLNFYGPPRTIRTVPYHRVLESDQDLDLAGRAVFVGFSERLQPEQMDGFYTAYTEGTGLDISGVEIAATTFANLLRRDSVSPLPGALHYGLIAAWGLLLAIGLRSVGGGLIPVVGLASAAAYLGAAHVGFVWAELWPPLVTPLLIQAPLAVLIALLWRYREVQRERETIRQAFGMHLPLTVVDELARDIDDFRASSRGAYGICLASDAEQYTRLGESLDPAALHELMNRYYAAVFPPVRERGGVVADVVGDAMLAIWASGSEQPALRQCACEAALALLEAVQIFNRQDPEHALPTRLGLHCGELVLGHVGAVDHYEYRAVGDIVNTASRIEGLSKLLGTRLLATDEVLDGLDGLVTRPLGEFLLKGKTTPVRVCEILGQASTVGSAKQALIGSFGEALQAFHDRRWVEAVAAFEAVHANHDQDGPARFFADLARRYASEPPGPDWRGVVTLTSK